MDLLVHALGTFPVRETATLIGMLLSVTVAFLTNHLRLKDLYAIGKEMHAARFAGIIVGMFFFLHIFQKTTISSQLKYFPLSPQILGVFVGFLLVFVTGRIQVPVSILVPIFMVKFGSLALPGFAVIYFSVFLGYILSPVHSCVSVSIEYFHISFRQYFITMAFRTLLSLMSTKMVSFVVL